MDWDNHHGDGTQSIFANDPSVYCISMHSAVDMYMAFMRVLRTGTTTAAEEVGHCNIPLLYHRFEDDFFKQMSLPGTFYRASESLSAFQMVLEQIPWQPDMILIFSGYDSHRDDGGKGITDWTDADYQTLTRMVLSLAQKADCPVLSTHGGGYKLDVTISAAVSHVAMLVGS